MEKPTILIVDDEWDMRNLLKIHLQRDFKVIEAKEGKEAIAIVDQTPIDIIILDIMMPDMSGWDVCEKIRKKRQLPIMMLTARTDIKDKVRGLEIGADDYLVKPFAPEELIARVNALLRRSYYKEEQYNDSTINIADEMSINTDLRKVSVHSKIIELTPKEFDLFALIAMNPKRIFNRETLLDKIWGIDDPKDARTVDTHIKNIRIKVREAGLSFNPIRTVWGVGYSFQSPDDLT
ncbi:response regulator transcription factor [Bacillus sp. Marseille-P3661]|uniref:response regulator transcription factor n=1 Tax=Bacillus sp. Marseille-P3661 TaxID=1936234 RepID=UPI000C854897|nr:response regulator transcription factor [Bacillus sp. Marseille-P3661]